jgi:hypothetical protein
MSFLFDPDKCARCEHGHCLEERRQPPAGGRQAAFLLKQQVALACTFDDFIPGSERDPQPARGYFVYLQQFRSNILNAGRYLFGDDFNLAPNAIAKLEDDIFTALESAALWNAAAIWNNFMESGAWNSLTLQPPQGAFARPDDKIAVIRLPQQYDATLLFDPATRADMGAFEHALNGRDMTLKLSCPDLVGIRLNPALAGKLEQFHRKVDTFSADNIRLLENAYQALEGSVSGKEFLFVISVKKTVSSHQRYQSLFEANVLKFLAQEILHSPAFRFNVHVGSSEASVVLESYKVASLHSLLKGQEPQRAVDRLRTSLSPLSTAQAILEDFPLFSTSTHF